MSLSDEVWNDGKEGCHNMYYEEDVKEFVKLLKKRSTIHSYITVQDVDDLAGDRFK